MSLQADGHWAKTLDDVVPSRRDDVQHRVLDGEAVLYDPATGCTHRLNATALAVWQACDGRSSSRGLAERLTRRYAVPMARAQADVEQLVASLAAANLLMDSTETDQADRVRDGIGGSSEPRAQVRGRDAMGPRTR